MKNLGVLIADDSRLFRESIKELLERKLDCRYVAEAENGLEAVRFIRTHEPDVILLDISMPKFSGLSAIGEIKRQHPETKILMLTVHEDEEFVLEAFESGADGYCLKDVSIRDLLAGVQSVLKGEKYICPKISEKVVKGYVTGKKSHKHYTSWDMLTNREKDVLKMVAEGYQNKEVANMLNISVKTVEKHRANIMNKTGLRSIPALTAYAIKKKLLDT